MIGKALSAVLLAAVLVLSGCQAQLPAEVSPEPVEAPSVAAEVPAEKPPAAEPEKEPEPVEQEAEPEPEPVREYHDHTAYMRGVDGFFFPDTALRRADAAQLLLNLFGPGPQTAAYWDVGEGDWYFNCTSEASAYLPGYADGSYRPYEAVTLEELVAALDRAVKLAAQEQAAAPMSLDQAVEAGWIDEETAAKWQSPEAENPIVSRAEGAAIVNRALGRRGDKRGMAQLHTPVFLDVAVDHPYYGDILEAALDHAYYTDVLPEHWDPQSVPDTRLSEGIHRSPYAAYYVDGEGHPLTEPGLMELDGGTYWFLDNGQVVADGKLHILDGNVVFFGEDGVMLKNGAWGEYLFDENGVYHTGDETLDGLVAAALEACTTEEMTREEQLRACYNYVRDFKYLGRNSALPNTCKTIPMENAVAYANKIFETGKGDCYNFAAAFCFLARALGYEASAIAGSCGYVWNTAPITHGWVEIVMDGETWLFDPQIENYNLRTGISNETHSAFQVTYAAAPGRYYKN